jgi:benzil reductase ((S)-benzoin forming)
LGRALFDQLVSQRYPMIGLGRDLARVATQAAVASGPVDLLEVDLEDVDALENALVALRRSVQLVADPLVFISNAGVIEPIGQAADLRLADLERVLRINCLAPLMIAHTLANIAYIQHRTLLILDISSGAADRPIRGWQAYCTSKAAYKVALDVLAAENTHVRVVHFNPGVMDTPMQEVIRQQKEADMPEVAAFRAYQTEGVLKAPSVIAAELILLMKRQLL